MCYCVMCYVYHTYTWEDSFDLLKDQVDVNLVKHLTQHKSGVLEKLYTINISKLLMQPAESARKTGRVLYSQGQT